MAEPESGADREAARIRSVYAARDEMITADRYSVAKPGALFMYQQRVRRVTRLLAREGFFPLAETRILDVGCGSGGWLVDFESWGAAQEKMAGVDIQARRVARARRRLRDADIREGNGVELPWDDGSFDLVLQSTVFTSILDPGMRQTVALEMSRVLAPGGAVLWYDFFRDNPSNPDVRGVRASEIRELFPGYSVKLQRLTLAPPISRRVARVSWLAALLLEYAFVLNTYYLGLLRRAD